MLQEKVASAHSLPIPRPRKRRRTATEALAGYFDSPYISRDFFTDMANTDQTICAVNSIIARNSSLLNDSRFQRIGSLNSQSHRHHRSLPARLCLNYSPPDASSPQRVQNTIQTSLDRRSKLMGRIQDISHLLLSHYDTEFMKETPYSSLNQPPPPPRPNLNAQPDQLRNVPLSPQTLSTVFSPSQGDDESSPRQLSPELRQRSPSIIIMDEVSDRPPSRTDAAFVVNNLPQGRQASFTASPPTPTRSIASLTSHTSSKWPHTPDNELGPSFAEISSDSYTHYASSYHHDNSNNTELTIVLQPQSPPTSSSCSWQQQQISSSVPSPKSLPATEATSRWMMTQIREGKEGKRSYAGEERPSSRAFSLDNILSPAPTAVAVRDPPAPAAPDMERTDKMVVEDNNTIPAAQPTEDVRIPFVETPEREMSVASDHPLQPRSRRRSKAMRIVESDDETESERMREKERVRERERVKKQRDPGSGKKQPRLTIKIRPLTTTTTSPSSSSSLSTLTSTSALKSSSLSSLSCVTVAEIKGGGKEEKEEEGSLNRLATSPSAAVSSTSNVPLTPSEQPSDALPPLIPGKARKRKAPPARKGWKGWVEVEVDETHRPIKSFSLDDLPVGERRTRSGKQFDG